MGAEAPGTVALSTDRKVTSAENTKSALSGGLLQANVDYDPDYTELVFMDECGTSSLAGNSMSAPDPYFSLAAVIINSRYYEKQLKVELESLKRELFPDVYGRGESVYFHYRDLFGKRGIFKPLEWSRIDYIWKRFLEFVGSANLVMQTVCISKQLLVRHVPGYDGATWEPAYETSLALHLERLVYWAEREARQDPLGKSIQLQLIPEGRNEAENNKVRQLYHRMRQRPHWLWTRHNTLKCSQVCKLIPDNKLWFYSKSDGQHGLEIVDMVANPLRKAVLREYGHLNGEMDLRERTFMDCTSERIFQKDGRRRGHGLKLYPA